MANAIIYMNKSLTETPPYHPIIVSKHADIIPGNKVNPALTLSLRRLSIP